jgi:hypothetical protein
MSFETIGNKLKTKMGRRVAAGTAAVVVRVQGQEVVTMDGIGPSAVILDTSFEPGQHDCDSAIDAVLMGTDVFSVSGVVADRANQYNDGVLGISPFSQYDGRPQSFNEHIETSLQNGA